MTPVVEEEKLEMPSESVADALETLEIASESEFKDTNTSKKSKKKAKGRKPVVLSLDPELLLEIIKNSLLKQFRKINAKLDPNKKHGGVRADILATQILRTIYKIPLTVVQGNKDTKFVRTQ